MMNFAQKVVSAARDRRLGPAIYRRIWEPVLENYFRPALKIQRVNSGELPSISRHGNFSASPESARLQEAFEKACGNVSGLSDAVRAIKGMSGQKYRSFINNFVQQSSDARYLEVGSWAGSTATAALFGNRAQALCIDNWSQFGGPRSAFLSNIELARSEKIDFRFIEQDFRAVDFRSIGRFNIYLFDGPHEEADQYDGIMLAQPALTERYLFIVDDWNWRQVRNGTFRALLDAKCRVESAIEVRTTLDNSQPQIARERGRSDWHNGYFLSVLVKSRPT